MAVTEQQLTEAYNWMNDSQQQQANQETAQNSWVATNTYNQGNWNLGNWEYWDTSIDRQIQILNNLDEAYKQDPSKFSDWNTFTENFNYNYEWRSDRERNTMRSWYENNIWWTWWIDYNNINNTDYFFNQLLQGTPITWTWAAVTSAQTRYKNYQSLSSMTPDQIASAVSSGAINWVWQDMIDLKNYSPALYAQVQAQLQWKTQVDDINKVWEWIYNWLTKTETNNNYTKYDMTTDYAKNASLIKQYNESLYKQISNLWWDTAAYVAIVASMLQNPVIQSNKDEIENLEWEINKINEQMYTIWDTARSVLWSEAPEDLVSAYISHQTKQLQNQLRTTQNSLLVAQWKLDNQLSEVETMIDAINNWIKLQESWAIVWADWIIDWYDYQTADPERLQQIQDNLDSIANSWDVYVFRDRNAFNDYFKYNQRWAAQRKVLDDYWNANAAWLKDKAQKAWNDYQASLQKSSKKSSWGWWWGGWNDWDWEITDDLVSAIKRDLSSWVVSFDATSMKKNYSKYWVKWWKDSTTDVVLNKIWKSSTFKEIQAMKDNLTASDFDKVMNAWADTNETAISDWLKNIWNWNTKKERESLANYLKTKWITDNEWKKYLLWLAWVSDRNINKIINL